MDQTTLRTAPVLLKQLKHVLTRAVSGSRPVRVLVATLLLVPFVLAGTAGPARAIAAGEDAAPGSYPFSVRLTMTGIPTADNGSRDSFCSGALIDPHWVITAGHCFREAGGERVEHTVARRTTATVGRVDLRGNAGHEVAVVAVRQSPTTDVALARIDPPVTDVVPLRVATSAPEVGELVRLTGYGFTARQARPAVRLQTGRFEVTSVGDTMIGMSGRSPRADTSPCPHDSGGPYFTDRGGRPELVAVVSGGPSCPHSGPDGSARVDNIAGWIAGETTRPALAAGLAALPWAAALVVLLAAVPAALLLARRRRRSPGESARRAPGAHQVNRPG